MVGLDLLDTPGYGLDDLTAGQLAETLTAMQQSDLVLLVLDASSPAREPDLDMLRRVRDWFRGQPQLKPPAVLASAAPSAPAKAPDAAPRLEGFAVQVGAFRDEAKLAQAREKLAAAKVPHYTERMEAKAGPLTRLRAGPFKTREAAESALAQLKLSALDGKVVPLP